MLCAIGALSSGALGLRAQTSLWNATSGNWSSGANWASSVAPANDGTVNISFDIVSPYTSTVDVPYSVISVNVLFGSGSFTLLGTTTLTVGASGFNDGSGVNVDVDPALAGTMALMQNGFGTLTLHGLNTYSGNTTVSSGTLADAGANTFSPNSELLVGVLGTVDVNSNETVFGLSGNPTGGSVVLANGATLTVGGTATIFGGVISGTGGALNMAGNVLDLTNENTYTGGTKVSAGTLEVDNNPLLGSGVGTGAITIMPGATLQIGNGGADTNGSVNAASAITDNGTLTIARADPFTLPNTITGTGGIIMIGQDGPLTLSGNNSYSGSTTVQFGELIAGSPTAFGNGMSAVDLISGGTLDTGTFGIVVGSVASDSTGIIHIGSGSLSIGGADTVTTFAGVLEGSGELLVVGEGVNIFTGPSTFNGTISIPGTGGILQVGDGSTAGASLASAATIIDEGQFVLEPAPSDSITYTGNISGGGSVVIQGTGTIKLGGINTYTGLTLVNSGTLADAAPNSFSPSSAVQVSGAGALAVNFNETVADLQDDEVGGPVSIAAGAILTSLGVNDAGDFQGAISGNGSLAISSGVQGLSGNNSYSGGTTLSGNGQLVVGSDTALGTGTLTINGISTEMSPDTDVALANNIILNGTMDNNSEGSSDLVLSGQITGVAGITWNSPGALTLTNGGNTFAGGVNMVEGTLFDAATGAPGPGTITLNTGSTLNVMNGVVVGNTLVFPGTAATLAGNGTIAVPVTVSSAVVLAPSASSGGPGNLTFSNGLTLASGATIDFNLFDTSLAAGTGYTLITATGATSPNLTANSGTITLNVATIDNAGASAAALNFFATTAYSWTFLTSTAAITGFSPSQFNIVKTGFVNATGSGVFSVTGTSNDLTLNFTPVPEPSTWVLMGVGVLAVVAPLALGRRRAARVQLAPKA